MLNIIYKHFLFPKIVEQKLTLIEVILKNKDERRGKTSYIVMKAEEKKRKCEEKKPVV